MFKKRSLFPLLVFLFSAVYSFSQNEPRTELLIKKAQSPIKIDGFLDEQDWMAADSAGGFYLNYPTDSLAAPFKTVARMTFDDQFLYVSFVCYDDNKPVVVQSLRRDFEWSQNDNIGIYFDPYNDFSNGFFFGVSPYGAQREGTISGGGVDPENSFNINWDNKWYSEVRRTENSWVAEFAIPFKSFRYNSAVNWNVAFLRQDIKHNQVSSWIRTPIQNLPASFPFSGKLVWQETPPKPGVNISLIPYAITSSYTDRENDVPREVKPNTGFDAKVAITPSMNMDLTVNPDFSTVDVDRQIVNLTRYEFQYPERRQFFLENSDLFNAPGFTTFTQPFFTRRIGLIGDSTGLLRQVPIQYGARLSGKIGSQWRLGMMNLQTGKDKSIGLPTQNYGVAVIQRQVLTYSNLSFVFVNKQSDLEGSYDPDKLYHPSLVVERTRGQVTEKVLNKYNRIAGADFSLVTKNNRWGGKMYYHRSFSSFQQGSDYSSGAFLTSNRRNLRLGTGFVAIGPQFRSEVGFQPGQDLYQGYSSLFLITDFPFYPRSEKIIQIMPGGETGYTYLSNGRLTEINNIARLAFRFRNTSDLKLELSNIYQLLPSDFNPIFPLDNPSLPQGEDYRWTAFTATFNSDSRKLLTARLIASGGQYYNGDRIGFGGTLTYRVQPYGNFSVTWDYNDIRLPENYGQAKFLLLSPRLDLTLSRKLFLTSFLQYNDRFSNVNLNTRLQWRFRPASDFFLVYAENYLPGSFESKNRSLVLKFTYWFNL
ncbi:MAG: DUF5916 domain-containing protein [Cyclobacteriaceae bacterium]